MDNQLLRAFRFYFAHSGYVVGERAAGALATAKAVTRARDLGLVAVWEPDDHADYSFVETWPAKDQRRWAMDDHFAETCAVVRPCPEHGVDCRHAEYLASCGGIVDADANYRRVMEGELFSEALASLAEVRRDA